MVRDGVPLNTFYGVAATYVALVLFLVLLPACVFIPSLSRARKGGLVSFGAFAHRFVQTFEERWADGRGGDDALRTPDVSSLGDLGGSYAVVNEVRVFPWTRRLLLVCVLWTLLPLLPLTLIGVGLPALLQRLAAQIL